MKTEDLVETVIICDVIICDYICDVIICDVKALAPVEVLEYMLACKKKETHAATPEVMCMLTHCSRRWLTG